LEVIIFDKDMR